MMLQRKYIFLILFFKGRNPNQTMVRLILLDVNNKKPEMPSETTRFSVEEDKVVVCKTNRNYNSVGFIIFALAGINI
jgi:hypothetical protein